MLSLLGADGLPAMAQLLLRNLDEDLVRRLQARAEMNRRSAEAEHRAILEEALRPSGGDFFDSAATLQAETRGRMHTDSAVLIRADRHRDHAGDQQP
jgi:plasmid stability protein